MKINHIDILSLPVTDQQRAKDFYVEKLGFVVVRDTPYMGDTRWIQVGPAGAQTSLTLVTWFEGMPAGSLYGMVLSTDDVDDAHKTLTERGVAVTAVESAPWGRYFTFSDPDGNGWVMQQNATMPMPASEDGSPS